MLDPITVIATASAAYNALKKGIEIGRELQDMGGQLATWAGAISDIDYLAAKAADSARGGRSEAMSKLKPSRSLRPKRRSKVSALN
jgi:hypothetical protein